jgi:hypothetical protein
LRAARDGDMSVAVVPIEIRYPEIWTPRVEEP